MQSAVFSLIVIFVLGFMNYFIFKCFFCKILFFKSTLRQIFWLLVIVTICEYMFYFNLRLHFLSEFFKNTFGTFLGLSFFVFFIAIFYSIIVLPLKFAKFDPQRREFLKKIIDFSTIVAGLLAIIDGFYSALKAPKITNLDIFIKNLQNELAIVQICDLHIGSFLGRDFLKKIILQINALKPDIVAITGDLIDFEPSKISEILSPLNDIKSKFGTFFVPGNHEYYAGIENVLKNLKSLNLQVLSNQSVKVGGVNLVGLFDFMGLKMNICKPDANLAMQNIDENLPTILLTHQPKTLDILSKNQLSKINLALLGHTHAGQIFPFHIFVKLANNGYLYGLYKKDNTQIYVSSGTGFWGPPIRFLSQSEIVKINLKKA